jgi:hypothetical protein
LQQTSTFFLLLKFLSAKLSVFLYAKSTFELGRQSSFTCVNSAAVSGSRPTTTFSYFVRRNQADRTKSEQKLRFPLKIQIRTKLPGINFKWKKQGKASNEQKKRTTAQKPGKSAATGNRNSTHVKNRKLADIGSWQTSLCTHLPPRSVSLAWGPSGAKQVTTPLGLKVAEKFDRLIHPHAHTRWQKVGRTPEAASRSLRAPCPALPNDHQRN